MIRGGVYRIDLGQARGHEQHGRRFGIVVSPSNMNWSVATIVPTSTSAQPSVFRPQVEIAGQKTLALCDQIRTIDTDYIHGDMIAFLSRDELAALDDALTRYLGLVADRPDDISGNTRQSARPAKRHGGWDALPLAGSPAPSQSVLDDLRGER